jgi:hypothetical protein
MKVSQLEKVFDLEVRELIQIDNQKLNGFLDRFKEEDCNQTTCEACQYCDRVLKSAAVINAPEIKKAAQRVRDFSDKLLTGEIFEIPPAHLLFRFPLIKTLLKQLLKWRMRKEQSAQ